MKKTFKEKVYELCDAIPKGKVATYGQLAKLAGQPKAARAVGAFMRMNPDAPNTPCHRVVSAKGALTGYSGQGGVAGKKKLLLKEGISFKGSLVELSVSQWKK
ncbi:hypothetical protein A2767_02370 [Candidatus Roizmanbacteria bacterium RIFCSPHIGHO2_01_FULL_35_10]|uniref:Methylated-DNA-[protein]-cysteine S-methyltransferase DNA binding domain-containing protein n=1 Tax=Candidatus Roizmanbacteria bacterium RIFCSPLOWO2_01_FULL_35_13 TaxID=1802055 RepID=A0A1F7I6Z0_9BACT|nr:MAG: hypothetical protein A2767_02370 [Candidatus Roizmanbacteria bacterium RIFCSPHIGHO2_01_FULL_35_10]OGK39125.1 MAG: hypothetical protein A3A74_08320 [Candidatus Roizmanbacteria bacterium RIFCSPLOWO2_01_FULL_35_13]